MPGLIDGCLSPDYDCIRTFMGREYTEEAVKDGRLNIRQNSGALGTIQVTDCEWINSVRASDGLFQVSYPYSLFTSTNGPTISAAVRALGDTICICWLAQGVLLHRC